jgi:ankyrin repeat protein
VEKLIDAGARVNAPPSGFDHLTALQGATNEGHKEIIDMLLRAGAVK